MTRIKYSTEEWRNVNQELTTLKADLQSLESELKSTVKTGIVEGGLNSESGTGKAVMDKFNETISKYIEDFQAEIEGFIKANEINVETAEETDKKNQKVADSIG